MATLVFGMNVSLDGYVDHDRFAPSPGLFAHFIEQAREQAGSLYGRKLYEIMAYWDEDRPEWNAPERAFAEAWRAQPKWVASRGAPPLGPNATLLGADLEAEIRTLKATVEGEIELGGPDLAASLAPLGLIDLYRLYVHPVVLGHGNPFFHTALPRLQLVATDAMPGDVIRLTYAPT
jgi:Dihydrofolate reductase